jgi:hypothetical protein
MYADTMQMSLVNGLKDLALAGGALMAMRAIGHLPKAEPVPPTTVRAGA